LRAFPKQNQTIMDIRNIAIIAHVDHGKTTLVDRILQLSKVFRDNQETGDLIMDSNELERERGITIFSKNASVMYKTTKINVIDTPGHSDFGGEVERVLKMADGVLLLVDAFEGTMPQTRFVLQKALQLNLHPIVVINKVDKPNCRPSEVHDQIFELFFNLGATEKQLDFPTYYGSGKHGWFSDSLTPGTDIIPLMEGILKYVPPPKIEEGNLQMQLTSIDYSSYHGRIGIGKVSRGSIKENQQVSLVQANGIVKTRIKDLFTFEGLGKKKIAEVFAGDICAVVGLDSFNIGDTIAPIDSPEGLPTITVDEPTMHMSFGINNSPFYGRDGKYVTSRHLKERLSKETEKNLALKVEETDSADTMLVYGRGILHLGILVETMRREGYELSVGQPKVIIKMIDGQKCEPFEILVVDVLTEYSGKVIDLVTSRKGEMHVMETRNDIQHLEFEIPSRGLIGLRSRILVQTAGEAIMSHRFSEYKPWKGTISGRNNGVLIAKSIGSATAYSIDKLQDRGSFFIEPGDEVYAGQIIGENTKPGDLVINACEPKKLSNVRASGSDDAARIFPKVDMTLEECMEYIEGDECIEVTPKNIRLRKVVLGEEDRKKSQKSSQIVMA
jgi:GTP-binding protein